MTLAEVVPVGAFPLLLAVACTAGEPASAAPVVPVAAPTPEQPGEPEPSMLPERELPTECGELALERRALDAEGKGEKHPRVVAVDERLAACSDRRPSLEACRRVVLEDMQNEENGYGERHPTRLVSNAKRSLCRETYAGEGVPYALLPPSEDECAAMRLERDRLLKNGYGERHPDMLAVEARLAQCRARE